MQESIPKESPFTPGRPVPIEYFVARNKEIQRLERAIQQTASGRNENIFIEGERGIGKSSLACFIRYLAEKKYSLVGSHCLLGGVNSLEGMMQVIFQRLLEQVTDKPISDKLKTIFSKHIKGVNLFGMGIDFTNDPSELRMLADNFLPVIRKIYAEIKETRQGLILILDDLNGITKVPEFSHFLKSTVDELAISNEALPLLLVLVGTSEKREDLIKHQPSVARIFDVISLNPMNKDESEDFFKNAFGKKNIAIDDPKTMSAMVDFSGGFPMLMHEIGDAVFWQDTDCLVDYDDAGDGILVAAKNVGKKYLDPQVYRTIGSETYRSILRKMGQFPLGKLQRKLILEKMTETEQKTFDNFLKKMKHLGMICDTEVRGEYAFTNLLYQLYVHLESLTARKH